jgi:3-oxoacyl-[acyl-carrier protein] reductase
MGRTMGTVPEGNEEHPLNRSAMPEELANVVRFLCSKESEYITGEVISVGGQRP